MNKPQAKYITYPVLWVVISIFCGCSGLRNLEQDQYLLNKITIKTDRPELREEMVSVIKQKPNRKILGIFRFHLGIYNLANRGKSTRFKNWVKNTIGEEPVILDSMLTTRTSDQLLLFMQNHGYFNAVVKDSTKYRKTHKANVTYSVKSNHPYKVRKINYSIKDSRISAIVLGDSSNCLIKPGANYDKGTFQKERERLSNLLKDEGYYLFNPLYITYSADTNLQSDQVNIFLSVADLSTSDKNAIASTHRIYHINNIFIQTDYNPLSDKQLIPLDTVEYQNYYFITAKEQVYNPALILKYIFIEKGDRYSMQDLEKTYKQLQELAVFRFIIIRYDLVPGSDSLNCYILLTPLARQEYKIEAEGTNTGGNLGVAGNVSYRNKNTFRGAEQFEFKLKGGVEAQRVILDTTQANSNITFFNEIGPVITLSVPRILFPFTRNTPFKNPQTNFIAAYNFQQRPEYQRTLANLSYSLNFKESQYKRHYFYPAEISFVKVKLQSAFKQKLDEINDQLLISSYSDQMITDFRYVFVYNTQDLGRLKNYIYFRGTFESAGHFIGLLNRQFNNNTSENQRVDIFNVPYAQYLRPDFDLRFYQIFNQNAQLVYRFSAGLGYAYGNSLIMPFEKSYYGGGANEQRAWRARSLGPGAISNVGTFEKNGDVKIIANVEYRFDIFRKLKGALFTDAGNIWLLKYDESRPAGQLKGSEFLNDVAIGSGMGMRFDFTFFIIRLDWAFKVKDPSLLKNEQWLIKNLSTKNSILNFGIGYPF